MADIAQLPWFLATGNYRGVVPDTLDVGLRPDQFRPWGAVTFTPHILTTATNKVDQVAIELRLTALTPPMTVLLTPVPARIETGVLRLPRANAPAGEDTPPTTGEIAAQQATDGVPLLAHSSALQLADGTELCWKVDFGTVKINDADYTYRGFYFRAPTIAMPQKWYLKVNGDPTGGTFITGVNGVLTAGIARNADAATVRTAIEALPNVAPGDLTVTGTDAMAGLTLTWGGALAGAPVAMTANPAGLVGNGVSVDVHELPGATVDLTTVERLVPAA